MMKILTLNTEIIDLLPFSLASPLERLMYNHLFKYLTKNNILYDK